MRAPLPETLTPRRAAQQGLVLEGTLPIESTPRLAQAYPLCAPVSVSLRFTASGEDRAGVLGELKTRIKLVCQRCLESFERQLSAQVDVEFGIDNAASAESDDEREILPGIDQKVALADFVEDELLLSAPMVALHEAGECQTPIGTGSDKMDDEVTPGRRNPFERLRSLLDGSEQE